jgi:hypothetical protein
MQALSEESFQESQESSQELSQKEVQSMTAVCDDVWGPQMAAKREQLKSAPPHVRHQHDLDVLRAQMAVSTFQYPINQLNAIWLTQYAQLYPAAVLEELAERRRVEETKERVQGAKIHREQEKKAAKSGDRPPVLPTVQFCTALQQARVKKGWTQQKLANECNVVLRFIQDWETGKKVRQTRSKLYF